MALPPFDVPKPDLINPSTHLDIDILAKKKRATGFLNQFTFIDN